MGKTHEYVTVVRYNIGEEFQEAIGIYSGVAHKTENGAREELEREGYKWVVGTETVRSAFVKLLPDGKSTKALFEFFILED